MLATLESNVKFQHFHYIVKLEILSHKNAQNSVFYYVHSHLANLFSVAVPQLKTKHLLGYGIWGGFPTDQQLPNGDAVYPTASLMLNPSVSVKWTMCKQPWHGQNSHTRIQKSALYYWIPFKRKSMVQLDNYSGWDDLWPWNIRLTCQPNGFLGAFLSLQRHFERIADHSQKEAKNGCSEPVKTSCFHGELLSNLIHKLDRKTIENRLNLSLVSMCLWFQQKTCYELDDTNFSPWKLRDFLRASHAFAEGSLPFRAGENWGKILKGSLRNAKNGISKL